jgi:hypothetical protein
MPEGVTADLLCTLTSLRMWEDLALERGWTATLYEESISQLAVSAVTAEEFRASSSPSHSLMTAPESIE